jgi:hypothetical protein
MGRAAEWCRVYLGVDHLELESEGGRARWDRADCQGLLTSRWLMCEFRLSGLLFLCVVCVCGGGPGQEKTLPECVLTQGLLGPPSGGVQSLRESSVGYFVGLGQLSPSLRGVARGLPEAEPLMGRAAESPSVVRLLGHPRPHRYQTQARGSLRTGGQWLQLLKMEDPRPWVSCPLRGPGKGSKGQGKGSGIEQNQEALSELQ